MEEKKVHKVPPLMDTSIFLPVDHDIKHWDEPETDVAKVGWQGLEVLLLSESVRGELLRELGVDLQVLLVPVVQEVVVRGHDPAELIHSVTELARLEEQQLDDEEADLSLVTFMVPERHAEDEPVQGDDVVFPDHAVHGVNTLVDVSTTCRLAELVNQEVAE